MGEGNSGRRDNTKPAEGFKQIPVAADTHTQTGAHWNIHGAFQHPSLGYVRCVSVCSGGICPSANSGSTDWKLNSTEGEWQTNGIISLILSARL